MRNVHKISSHYRNTRELKSGFPARLSRAGSCMVVFQNGTEQGDGVNTGNRVIGIAFCDDFDFEKLRRNGNQGRRHEILLNLLDRNISDPGDPVVVKEVRKQPGWKELQSLEFPWYQYPARPLVDI